MLKQTQPTALSLMLCSIALQQFMHRPIPLNSFQQMFHRLMKKTFLPTHSGGLNQFRLKTSLFQLLKMQEKCLHIAPHFNNLISHNLSLLAQIKQKICLKAAFRLQQSKLQKA